METEFVIVIVVVAVAIALAVKLLLRSAQARTEISSSDGYRRRTPFLSPAERSFLGVLDEAVGSTWRVLVKVRVADLVQPRSGLTRSSWRRAFNRISAKHVDYVLVDPSSLEPKLVIELNDGSHRRRDRQERDALLKQACQTAQLELLEIDAARGYVVEEIRTRIHAKTAQTGDAGAARA